MGSSAYIIDYTDGSYEEVQSAPWDPAIDRYRSNWMPDHSAFL